MKKVFRRILRIVLAMVVLLVLSVGVLFLLFHEKRPTGTPGAAAEALADKMLAAVNADAWDDLVIVEWDFPRGHHHLWDRQRHLAQVTWGDNRALVDPKRMEGVAYQNGQVVSGEEGEALTKEAIHLFWNDSFWLAGFLKVRDPGTTREVVELEDGKQGLLVTYSSGGMTPGDAYLWKLREDGRPESWQMWVEILPIGGLEFTWSGWQELPGGAMVAPVHDGDLLDVVITDVKGANSLSELGHPEDLFAPLTD